MLVRSSQSQRLIGELAKLRDRLHQLAESKLAVFDGLTYAVLHDPALKVYRLSGWRWQLDSGSILEHPPDLLKVLPGSLARGSGCLQLIE